MPEGSNIISIHPSFECEPYKSIKMKKLVLSLSVMTGLFILMSFVLEAATVKEERKVRSFEGISLALSADVGLRQGNETKVVLEGPSDFLAKVETVTEGGILKIRFYNRYINRETPSGRIRIYITTPDVKSLIVTGSGKIEAVTPVKTGNVLKMLVTGNGDIIIKDLTAKGVKMSVTGSGAIRVAGPETLQEEIVITGSGNVYAEKLPAREAKVSITGSGDAHVRTTDNLKVGITGSGDVYYSGPGTIDARITGSGEVKRNDER